MEQYFAKLSDIGTRHQTAQLNTNDPLDPLSPEIPPLIAKSAAELASINAPMEVRSLHKEYAASVQEFAGAVAALSKHDAEVARLQNDNATPTSELVALLTAYDAASTRVGDACVKLQEIANQRKIDVDIGCRGATAEFKCYSTNALSVTNAQDFADARRRVETVAGHSLPIPTALPAWVDGFQVGMRTNPVEVGDSDSADMRFVNNNDRSAPQVVLSFTPRPFCSSSQKAEFSTIATAGSQEFNVQSVDITSHVKGVEAFIRLPDVVVTIAATWEVDYAPPYDAMVPVITEWARLVLEAFR